MVCRPQRDRRHPEYLLGSSCLLQSYTVIPLDALQHNHAILAEMLQARRSVSMETLQVGTRLL